MRLDAGWVWLLLAVSFAAGCGTVSYERRVLRDPLVVSEGGDTAWSVETWNEVDRSGTTTRIRQRTEIVVCRPDRVPTCVRVVPTEISSRAEFEEWIASGADDCGP